MKRLLFIIFTLLTLPSMAQVKGVTYYDGTVYEALSEASRTGKLLLVEFYAQWNYKSRWMRENTISKSDLTDFIVVAVDVKTKDGAALAQTYEVVEYPNILIFSNAGNVLDRIDKPLTKEDFEARAAQAILAMDGHSTIKLRQIYLAVQKGDKPTMNQLVHDYLHSFDRTRIKVDAFMDLFTSKEINYYGSASFDYMYSHPELFDTLFFEDRMTELFIEATLPYISGTEPYDSIVVAKIAADASPRQCAALVKQFVQLSALRHEHQYVDYMQLIDILLIKVDPQYQYPLLLSLDFIDTSKIDKAFKRLATRNLEAFAAGNESLSKNIVIQSLLSKFL